MPVTNYRPIRLFSWHHICQTNADSTFMQRSTSLVLWASKGQFELAKEKKKTLKPCSILTPLHKENQISFMRQVLGPGSLGRPRGIGWRGRWEVGSGWGIHVYPRLIHVNVWQKPLQYCKVISLHLIKKNNNNKNYSFSFLSLSLHTLCMKITRTEATQDVEFYSTSLKADNYTNYL